MIPPSSQLKNRLPGHLNSIHIYSLKVITPSFSHLSIEKLFCTGKNHLVLMTEIAAYILSQYLWYNANIQVDKTSVQFSRFSEKISVMLHNFLMEITPLKMT